MVDLVVVLGTIDPTILILLLVLIFILQSPVLTFPGYLIMMYAGLQFGTFQGGLINYLGICLSTFVGYQLGKWSALERSDQVNNKYIQSIQIDHYLPMVVP